jgi:ACR3 family arsenite transporter
VLDILPDPQRAAFAEEDGERVVDEARQRISGRGAMSDAPASPRRRWPRPALGTVERYLSVWVALCIVAGIAPRPARPGAVPRARPRHRREVNLPVAVLVWLMIVPMLLKIDLAALGQVRRHWRGIGVTLFINWAVKPFSMALLGWLFVGWLFRDLLPAGRSTATSPG